MKSVLHGTPQPTPTASSRPQLVPVNVAAQMLALSPRSVWTLVKSGTLPAVRLGRAVRFDVEDIAALIAQSKGARS